MEGATEDALLVGVTNFDLLVSALELLNKAVVDLLVNNEATEGGATLTSGTNGGKEDRADSQIQVGIILRG